MSIWDCWVCASAWRVWAGRSASKATRAAARASSRNCHWTCQRASMSDKIQVVIVDDHPLFRDGLIQTLKAEPDIEVVGQATTASEAVSLVGELVPDVVLLDIAIPGSGLKAATSIAAASPITKMIMLTASEAEE